MRTHKDTVVVIKSLDYSETDKILTVFGRRTGKFSLLAKGIRKISSKNRGNMQTLSLSRISYYQGSGIPILMETENISYIDFTTEDMTNLERVLLLLNKLLPEEDPSEKIFKALKRIIEKGISIDNVNKFRALFLSEQGFLDSSGQCSICSEQNPIKYIDLKTFELLCESCYSKKESKSGMILKLGGRLYESTRLTQALDKHITNLIAQA